MPWSKWRVSVLPCALLVLFESGCGRGQQPPPGAGETAAAVEAAEPVPLDPVDAVRDKAEAEGAAAALDDCRELAVADDPRVRSRALAFLPELLGDACVAAWADGRADEAKVLFAELVGRHPAQGAVIGRVHGRLWEIVTARLERGDKEAAVTAALEVPLYATREPVQPFIEAVAVEIEGTTAGIDRAAELAVYRGGVEFLVQRLARGNEVPALLDAADAAAQRGAPATVALLVLAALDRAGRRGPVDNAWRGRAAERMMPVLGGWVASRPARMHPHSLVAVLELAGRRLPDRARILAWQTAAAGDLARWLNDRGLYVEAGHAADRVGQLAEDAWAARMRQPDADPRADLPPEIAELLEDEHPFATREEAVRRIQRYINDDRFRLPAEVAMDALRQEIEINRQLADLRSYPDRALTALRAVLRCGTTPQLRVKIGATLQEAVLLAGAERDAQRLERLAGFLISELPAEADAAFRAQLGVLLGEAAAAADRDDTHRRHIFLLSLLADLTPGTDAGKAAREQAVAAMRELTQMSTPRHDISDLKVPSGLAGMSVVRLDNATSHHLLAFFDGPEVFFVRVGPYRRGSVVLRDGKYQTLALVTDDSVAPYRIERDFSEDLVLSEFKIQIRSGGEETYTEGGSTWGAYVLLRQPTDVVADVVRAAAEGKETDKPGADADAERREALDAVAGADGYKVRQAIGVLSRYRKDPEAFAAISRIVRTYDDPLLRAFAIKNLVPFRRYFDVNGLLMARLAEETEAAPANMAARTLISSGLLASAEPLLPMATSDDRRVRLLLVSFLEQYHERVTPEVAEAILLAVYRKDPEDWRTPLRTMGAFHLPAGRKLIREKLRSEDAEAREQLGFVLFGWRDDAPTMGYVAAHLQKEPERAVRRRLVSVLARSHLQEAQQGVAWIVDNYPGQEAGTAMGGLGELALDDVCPSMRAVVRGVAADRSDGPDGRRAVELLCKWRDTDAIPILRKLAAAGPEPLRTRIAEWTRGWDIGLPPNP